MSYLLDSNVVSELRKREGADPQVRDWFSGVENAELFLSVLTLGEIRLSTESIGVTAYAGLPLRAGSTRS